ncbi:MAG: metal-sulfur cluster assembly factor, partial [Ktedonobacterales bacterium]
DVPDPELGISLVDMGLIVDVRRDGDVAHVTITYTAMGCPATEMIEGDIRARLLRLPGVSSVALEVVWEPVWTKARLTEEGRDALLLSGVSV